MTAAAMRLPLASLRASPENPRKISASGLAGLGVSMQTFGPLDICFNDTTGQLVSGHQRIKALQAAGALDFIREGDVGYVEHPATGERFPIRFVQWDATKERMGNLVANSPELQGEFTEAALEQVRALEHDQQFKELQMEALQEYLEGQYAAASSGQVGGVNSGGLMQKFGIPPFSILDARQGYWKDRKSSWLSLGIRSELGRGATVAPAGGGGGNAAYQPVGKIGKKSGRGVRS